MANKKITALDAVTTADNADLVPIVVDVATTPVNKKITKANLLVSHATLADPTFTGTVTIPTPFTLGAVSVLPTGTELNYVDGVTSAIQTQLNAKAPSADPTFTGTVTIPTPFTLGAVSVLPTGTELNFVDGVTSSIQDQLNAKQGTLTNSAGLAAALSDETGTGLAVFSTSPALVTPALGVASATSINKITVTAPATGATLTIVDGKTLTVSNTADVSGTNTGDVTLAGTPDYITISGQTITRAKLDPADDLNTFASSVLAGLLTDETGTDKVVFNTAPAFVTSISTPSIITASGALGITPASGSNLNVTLATTGDFAVNTNQLYVDTSTGNVGIGTAAPSSLLTLEMNATDGIFMDMSATSDVAHPMTTPYPNAYSFGVLSKLDANYGGLVVSGISSGNVSPMTIVGSLGVADPTDTIPAFSFLTRKSNGVTGLAALGALETAFVFDNHATRLITVLGSGNVGIGTTSPASKLSLAAGSATANTAPLQFTSGTVETTARAGVVEFTTDDLFFTITTGAARQKVVLTAGMTSGHIPYVTTNGRLASQAPVADGTYTVGKGLVTDGTITITNGVITAIQQASNT